jgi:hypothetical protein
MCEQRYLEMFSGKFPIINTYLPKSNCEDFALDEFRRFMSIAGTIRLSFNNEDISADGRIITHILLRSLLEKYFCLLYVFFEEYSSFLDHEI